MMGWDGAAGDLTEYEGPEVAEPVDLAVKPDGVSPEPILVAVEGSAILIFQAARRDRQFGVAREMTTVEISGRTYPTPVPHSQRELGVLRFHECYDVRMGSPNDEGFRRHPLGGSIGPWLNIVRNSRWAAVSYDHSKPRGSATPPERRLTHFLLSMKENTFECLAGSFSVDRVLAAPHEVAFDLLA